MCVDLCVVLIVVPKGKEWTFSPSGVFHTAPRLPELGKFKTTIDMGCHLASARDFDAAIAALRQEFPEGKFLSPYTVPRINHYLTSFQAATI